MIKKFSVFSEVQSLLTLSSYKIKKQVKYFLFRKKNQVTEKNQMQASPQPWHSFTGQSAGHSQQSLSYRPEACSSGHLEMSHIPGISDNP